jgi:hypothetical protein
MDRTEPSGNRKNSAAQDAFAIRDFRLRSSVGSRLGLATAGQRPSRTLAVGRHPAIPRGPEPGATPSAAALRV